MTISRLNYAEQVAGAFALYADINDLGDQHDDFYDTFTVEHTTGGIHDAATLPKGSGRIVYVLGTPSLAHSTGIVTSMTPVSTGINNISISPVATSTIGMHIDCIIHDDSVGYTWSYTILNSGTIQVQTRDAATQTVIDVDFTCTVWTDGNPDTTDATSNPVVKRNHVSITSDSPTVIDDLNEIIDSSQQYYDAFTIKHNPDGTHNDDILSRAGGIVSYSGQSFIYTAFGPVEAISNDGAGKTKITLSSMERVRNIDSMHVCVKCDYDTAGYYTASVRINSAQEFTVYTRDSSNDALVDKTFRFTVWYSYE